MMRCEFHGNWKCLFRLMLCSWIVSCLVFKADHCCIAFQGPEIRRPEGVRQIDKGLFQVSGSCNSYILQDNNRAIVFDPGSGVTSDLLSEMGIEKVDYVFLTSHHREQVQGRFAWPFEQSQFICSDREAEILRDPVTYRKWRPVLGDPYSVYGASYVRPPAEPLTVTRPWKDGQHLQWQRATVSAHFSPGASPGGMAYTLEIGPRRYLISGKLIHHGARMCHWYDSEWDYGFGEGLDQLMRSIERLCENEWDRILPAHGPILTDPKDQLVEYNRKLTAFRKLYLRGYPVFDADPLQKDAFSKPTKVEDLHQVSQHLFKLDPRLGGLNFNIIVTDDGHGLILDCGLLSSEQLDAILLGMREHLGLKSVDALWISHMHGDHFLLAQHLRQKYNTEIWTLDRIADPCERPRDYDHAALVSAYGDGFDGISVDRRLEDGHSFQWHGLTLRCDWMPGQTIYGNCLSLELDGRKIAFTGDNIFAKATDAEQNGHEAVVCRNDALLENGYMQGAEFLRKLDPDMIVGGHSYVMPEPRKLIQRYWQWSRAIQTAYKELLPGMDYRYGFDPYWVQIFPYRIELQNKAPSRAQLRVKNFDSAESRNYQIEVPLPTGLEARYRRFGAGDPWSAWRADSLVVTGTIPPADIGRYDLEFRDAALEEDRLYLIPLDITYHGQRHGRLFDFLLKKAARSP